MSDVTVPGAAEGRSADRLVTFSDGVVAIALTLLVLPLVEVAKETEHTPVPTVLRDHLGDFLAFTLSFVVVGLLWRIHHRLFDVIAQVDEWLLILNTFWLLGVVFLPAPTAVLTFEESSGRAAALLYLATLLYVSICGLLLDLWVRRHPELQRPGHAADIDRFLVRSLVTSSMIVLTMVVAVLLGEWGLVFLCVLPVTRRFTRVAQN